MKENRIIANNGSSIVLYTTDDGNTQLEVKLEKDTVWLTQSQMAELFDKDQSVIARHIKNAFNEGEVNEKSNMQILHNTQYKYRPTKIYNLDVIISVGKPEGCHLSQMGFSTHQAIPHQGLCH